MSLNTPSRRRIGRQVATPPRPGRTRPASPALPLPEPVATVPTHETATQPDPVMRQAKRDLDAGMVDTDLRATAGLDAQRRARLVPGAGPGGKPPRPAR